MTLGEIQPKWNFVNCLFSFFTQASQAHISHRIPCMFTNITRISPKIFYSMLPLFFSFLCVFSSRFSSYSKHFLILLLRYPIFFSFPFEVDLSFHV